jgi:hypothetical protein
MYCLRDWDLTLADRVQFEPKGRLQSLLEISEHGECYASHHFAFLERSGVTFRPEYVRFLQSQLARFLS